MKYWHYTVLVFFAMLLLTDVKISLEWNRKCWTLSPGATDKLSQSYKMAATGRHFTTLRHISLKVVLSVYVCCWHVSLLSEQLLFWATVVVCDWHGRTSVLRNSSTSVGEHCALVVEATTVLDTVLYTAYNCQSTPLPTCSVLLQIRDTAGTSFVHSS